MLLNQTKITTFKDTIEWIPIEWVPKELVESF